MVHVNTHLSRGDYPGEKPSGVEGDVIVQNNHVSNGDYTVLQLTLGEMHITVWPGENVTRVADLLGRLSASLHSAQAQIDAKNKAEAIAAEEEFLATAEAK